MCNSVFCTGSESAAAGPLYASDHLYSPRLLAPSDAPLVGDVTTSTVAPSGGGGLVSTLADYLAFTQCLLQGGAYDGGRLLSRKTVSWMTANHIPASFFPLWLDTGKRLRLRIGLPCGRRSGSSAEVDLSRGIRLVRRSQHLFLGRSCGRLHRHHDDPVSAD